MSGAAAVAVQGLFLAGLVYGTMHAPAPEAEKVTTVSVLHESPVVDAAPPPAPPRLAQPVIHLPAPLLVVTDPEPPAHAPTAMVSNLPPPPPVRVDAGERERERMVAEFQRALQRHLIRHMRYPLAARARKEEGVVYVRVAMDRRGYVLSAKVQDASNFPQLDEEGVAVVTRAQPLPAPPEAVAGETLDLIIPVTFSLKTSAGRSGRAPVNETGR